MPANGSPSLRRTVCIGLAVGPLAFATGATRVFGVAARGLAGGAFFGFGHVVGDLLDRRLLGHLIRGLQVVRGRPKHHLLAYPHP